MHIDDTFLKYKLICVTTIASLHKVSYDGVNRARRGESVNNFELIQSGKTSSDFNEIFYEQ